MVPPAQGSFNNIVEAALAAGTIQLSGPTGQFNMGSGPGIYQTGINVSPGAYTFTGSGGKDVGSVKVSVDLPAAPFNVTNQNALGTIDRSKGFTVTWTGGFPNGTVQIEGAAGAPPAKFFCYAPSSAGQFTVPSSILLALPPGFESLFVGTATAPQTISASGLDLGLAVNVAEGVTGSNKLGVTYK